MNKKNPIKNLPIVIAFIAITFYVLLKDISIKNLINSISMVNVNYIFAGIILSCIFVACEGINTFRLLNLGGSEISLLKGIKYACIGFFFSSITPSASGGQPMQIYYMKKDDIDISDSTIALLVELISYQIVTLSLALILFIYKYDFIKDKISFIIPILIFGAIANIALVSFIILVFLSENLAKKVINSFIIFLHKIKIIKNLEDAQEISINQINQFKTGVNILKNNTSIFIKVFSTTLVQLISMYSVAYCVYKAFGMNGSSYIEIISLQAIFTLSVSALPLPGAIGISEGGFLQVFSLVFPQKILASAMLINRGLSFYMLLIITGVIVLINHIRKSFVISAKNVQSISNI